MVRRRSEFLLHESGTSQYSSGLGVEPNHQEDMLFFLKLK